MNDDKNVEPNNLVQLIRLLQEYEEQEPDPNLKPGQVYGSNGEIITL